MKSSKPIAELIESDFWKNMWAVFEVDREFKKENVTICDYNAKNNKDIDYLANKGYNIERNENGSNKKYTIVLSTYQINENMSEYEINNHIYELEQISKGAIIFTTNKKVNKLNNIVPTIKTKNFNIYFS
tara:strand:- start:19839 stop:20228 length:390 start_codon:yes stop_codon:yes gene_type:complete